MVTEGRAGCFGVPMAVYVGYGGVCGLLWVCGVPVAVYVGYCGCPCGLLSGYGGFGGVGVVWCGVWRCPYVGVCWVLVCLWVCVWVYLVVMCDGERCGM